MQIRNYHIVLLLGFRVVLLVSDLFNVFFNCTLYFTEFVSSLLATLEVFLAEEQDKNDFKWGEMQ